MWNVKFPFQNGEMINLDWMLKKVTILSDSINKFFTEVTPSIVEKIVKDEQLPDLLNSKRYANDGLAGELYVYIAAYGGDDNNDGTAGRPVKTIKKAMEIASRFHNDVRLYFIEGGTYVWDMLCFTAQTLHIHTSMPGVIIESNRNMAFYNAHINITCEPSMPITFKVNSDEKYFYMDGGQAVFTYVNFDCILVSNFAGIGLNHCDIKHLRAARGGSITINNCVVSNACADADVFYSNQGSIWVTGDFSIIANENNANRFINATGSFIGFQYTSFSNANSFTCGTNSRIISGSFQIPGSFVSDIEDIAAIDFSTTAMRSYAEPGRVTSYASGDVTVSGVSYYELGSTDHPENLESCEVTITRKKVNASTTGFVQVRVTIDGANHYQSMALYPNENNFCTFNCLCPTRGSGTISVAVQNANGETMDAFVRMLTH